MLVFFLRGGGGGGGGGRRFVLKNEWRARCLVLLKNLDVNIVCSGLAGLSKYVLTAGFCTLFFRRISAVSSQVSIVCLKHVSKLLQDQNSNRNHSNYIYM